MVRATDILQNYHDTDTQTHSNDKDKFCGLSLMEAKKSKTKIWRIKKQQNQMNFNKMNE